MVKLKVGVIFGGISSEREVSLATGRYVYSLLDPAKFEGIPLFMDGKGGIWQIPDRIVILNTTADVEAGLRRGAEKIQLEDLKERIDLVFIALLGKYGEDGCIQGILELLGIPYTGSGVLASAVGMNKRAHKELFRSEGILVARDLAVRKADWENNRSKIKDQISKIIGFPCVVKPTREGSSIGVSTAKDKRELERSVKEAFKWDSEILAEEYIEGEEFMCVVLGNEDPSAMLPSEVEFVGEIHTYESKYMPGKAKYHTPIRGSKENIKHIQELAVKVYRLTHCKGYGRVDGFLVGDKVYVSEPHTGTIMVPSSYVFQQAARHKAPLKGGRRVPLSPRALVTKIIELALEVHEGKKGPLQ